MLEFNGKLYARVSDVIKPFTNFGGIDEKVLNAKAALGTRVHNLIKDEIDGNLPIAGIQEAGYVKSFEHWRSSVSVTFVESEMRYYCDKKMITGCIDALVKLEGNEETILVDFKTSVQESPTWIMQAHLYHYLISSSGKCIAPRFLFLKLDKYGKLPKVFHYKFDLNVWAQCSQAIDDFWKREKCCH